MDAHTLVSPHDSLEAVNTTMFRLQNALRGPITNIADTFPLKEGANCESFEDGLALFGNKTLNMVLHEAVMQSGDARDFCGKASIDFWLFDGVNPFKLLFPFYKTLIS